MIFVVKAGAYPSGAPYGTPFYGRLLAKPSYNKLIFVTVCYDKSSIIFLIQGGAYQSGAPYWTPL